MRWWRAALGCMLVCGVLAYGVMGLLPRGDRGTISLMARSADAQPMIVQEVLDGDTIVLAVDRPGEQVQSWGRITARLLGVDSPNFGIVDDCYAVEAQARLAQLLPEGSVAWAEIDEQARDDGGRWLMYLWTADGRFVNYELTVDGFVAASAMPPNEARWKMIEAGQTQAVARLWGIWGECGH